MEHHLHHHHLQRPKRISTSESVPTLPTEIIVEILLRLPVESVLRCKSVCKSWRSLISDPQFVKSHLAISTTNNHYAHHRLIYSTEYFPNVSSRPIIKLKTCHLHDVLHDKSVNNDLELDYPLKHQSGRAVSIVGSCNGLVCIAVEEDIISTALFIWNPSTRKSNRLPSTGYNTQLGWCVVYGFGYDESTDDYKVVEVSRNNIDRPKWETLVRIYSLKNGSWKKIGAAFSHGFRLYDYGKFCNGGLHWAANKDLGPWTIVSLDLAKETCGEVLQPVYDAGDEDKDLTLGSLRQQLCVLCDYPEIRADLWVMEVYGVKESWAKLVSIPCLRTVNPWVDWFLMPLCMSNDGKILLPFGLEGWSKLIVYDSKNGLCSENQSFGECLQASTFVESLVSPMPAAGLGDI